MADIAPAPMEMDAPVVENAGTEAPAQNVTPVAEKPASDNVDEEKAKEDAPSETKKILLRFDDGTVVRFKPGAVGEAEILHPEAAWKAGFLKEEHLLRIQSLLCEVHAKLPDEGPLKSVSLGSKRSLDTVLEVGMTFTFRSTWL